jgi:hypothetical protein
MSLQHDFIPWEQQKVGKTRRPISVSSSGQSHDRDGFRQGAWLIDIAT